MTFWKPLAVVSTSIALCVAGHSLASAASSRGGAANVEGPYTNMEAALSELRAARAHLDRAEHNKGGWRERAAQATDHAIDETKRAIEVR